MFAPVASRLRTYGIPVSRASSGYMKHVLGIREMVHWYEQAAAETETLAMAEVGVQGE